MRRTVGWIGVALDGVLARTDTWQPVGDIGEPIPAMVERIHGWLKAGYKVRIMTGRVATPQHVHEWLRKHIGRELPITDQYDNDLIELYDYRVVQVEANTGKLTSPSNRGLAS